MTGAHECEGHQKALHLPIVPEPHRRQEPQFLGASEQGASSGYLEFAGHVGSPRLDMTHSVEEGARVATSVRRRPHRPTANSAYRAGSARPGEQSTVLFTGALSATSTAWVPPPRRTVGAPTCIVPPHGQNALKATGIDPTGASGKRVRAIIVGGSSAWSAPQRLHGWIDQPLRSQTYASVTRTGCGIPGLVTNSSVSPLCAVVS